MAWLLTRPPHNDNGKNMQSAYRNKSYTLYTDSLTIEYRLFTQLVNEYDTVAGYTDFLDSVQTKANQLSGMANTLSMRSSVQPCNRRHSRGVKRRIRPLYSTPEASLL